jgi:hypothetical protein
MKPVRCILGFHRGNTYTSNEVRGYDGTHRVVFKCERCGKVIE